MLWNRVYRLEFPDIGYTIDRLRVRFQVEKDLTKETNKTKIVIFNLSPENRQRLEKADLNVNIFAGYADNGGAVQMFSGSVSQAFSTDTGADVTTELQLSDGQTNLRDTVVSVSFSPGTSGERALREVANQMGLAVRIGEDVTFSAYSGGFSYVGYGRDALTEICDATGCTWSVQNGVLQVILSGGTTGVRGLVFSPSSGLIGSPRRIIKAPKKESVETPKRKRRTKAKKQKIEKKAGWKIETLLAPTVIPGDLVKVESRMITGWFRVEAIRHSGDSHGGDWKSEMDLIERGAE